MAMTATVPSDTHELERELHIELEKLEAVQGKLDSDKHKLQEARDKRAHLVAAIPHGRANADDVTKIETEIHHLEILVEGNTPISEKHRGRIEELQAKIREIQTAAETVAKKAAREKEYTELKGRTGNRAALIRDVLTELCTEALVEFEQDRARLAVEFPDLGGVDAAVALGQELFSPTKGLERVRNPNVHLAQLEARGYIGLGAFVNPFGSTKDIWKPGLDPVLLTVYGMRPKT